MNKKVILLKKFLSFCLGLSIIFNSFAPGILVAFAQEETQEETTISSSSPTPTPQPEAGQPLAETPEPTKTPSPEPSVTPEPSVEPAITQAPAQPESALTEAPIPLVNEEPSVAAEPVSMPEVVQTPTPLQSRPTWIINEDGGYSNNDPLETNKDYYPLGKLLHFRFTHLPETSGTITIKEVAASFNIGVGRQVGSVYEITSSMPDGTFLYDLTLPLDSNGNPKGADVAYSEDGNTFQIVPNEKSIDISSKQITIRNLDHFTLFVVTTVGDFENGDSSNTQVSDEGEGDGSVSNALDSETSDQSQASGTIGQAFDNTTWLSQTFTAGSSGFLTKVTLSLRRAANSSGNVTVEIRDTIDGSPGSTVLATSSRPASNLTSSQADYDFTFSLPPVITSGTTYAIVIYRSGSGTITADYTWFRASATGGNNPYTAGKGYTSSNSGSTWTLRNSGNGDQRFSTSVQSYFSLGTQTSDVLDTDSTITKYTQLSWTEDLPAGTDITFEVRASSEPLDEEDEEDEDVEWVSLDSANSPVDLSTALPDSYQYFQWRATLLGTPTQTPILKDVTVTYDADFPDEPVATPAAGDYTSDQIVSLSSSDSSSGLNSIYYTTDGTTPSSTNGILYSGAITIDKDTTLQAIAYDNVGNASSVLTAIYGIAPLISDQSSSSVSDTSTAITWTTDDPSTSRVIYDTVSHPVLGAPPNYDYASSTVEDSTLVTFHSVSISGLSASTTYYYRTVSHGSPESVGDENSFTTSSTTTTVASASTSSGGGGGGGGGGASASVCSDTKPGSAPILLLAIPGFNSVTLVWSEAKDPVSYYLVAYGLVSGSPIYGNPNIGGKGTTTYTVNNLSGGTTYYFKVRAGNGCTPGDYSNELSAVPFGAVATGIPSGFREGVLGTSTPSGEPSPENKQEETGAKEEVLGQEKENIPEPQSKTDMLIPAIIALILMATFTAWFLRKKTP